MARSVGLGNGKNRSLYSKYRNDKDRLLKDGLKALLEWLPEAGRQSLANDVSRCIADKALSNVFHGLLTCLVVPSMFMLGSFKCIDCPYSQGFKCHGADQLT